MFLPIIKSFVHVLLLWCSALAAETAPILGEPGNADVDYLKIWLRMLLL